MQAAAQSVEADVTSAEELDNVTGPVIGGVLIAAIGWRRIFFINIPIGLFGMWLTWRYVAATPRTRSRGLDYSSQVLAILGLAVMAAAIIEAGRVGWTNQWIISGFAVVFVALFAFVVVEHKGRDPMLPPSLFKDRRFSASTAIGRLITVRPLAEDLLVLRTYLASRADEKSKVMSELVRTFMRRVSAFTKVSTFPRSNPVSIRASA
jgi:MFS family permease